MNDFVIANSDDEMYESSSFDAKQRLSTLHLQHKVASPVVGTPEHACFAPVRSPESLDALLHANFKEEKHIVESRRRPLRCWNKTSPFGRCSELQGALQRKQPEDRDQIQKDSQQPYGSSVYSEEVQEIEKLFSDDSLDFEKRSSERTTKRPSIEIGRRITRSRTQSSHGLPLSTEKQARKDALDALRRQKDSRKR